ncbi:hypothetical protein RI543_005081 [Arxiozyma heterogenica]|uniref:Uncharacterized protein n=1 Tax=Arxiozyma heterogenica TaxID=278026 RepID=A0AAN7ZR78_9SACH|nr:hypothetical protein RI543_005081 [Kazachstania heterogenica]
MTYNGVIKSGGFAGLINEVSYLHPNRYELKGIVFNNPPEGNGEVTGSDATLSSSIVYTTRLIHSNGSSSTENLVAIITSPPPTTYASIVGSIALSSTLPSQPQFLSQLPLHLKYWRNSTIPSEKTKYTLSNTLVVLTTVFNRVTMTTTYCPEPSATSGTSMTAIIGHSSLESVYTNSKNQQEKTNSLSAVSNATLVISIASTTTGPAFTNNENQPKPRNSRASTTIVAGFTKGTTDIASETGTVVGTVKSRRLETLLTTMVPQVSQYVSEQLFSSSTAVTVSHGGIPSLASYEGKGSTMYMKWSVAHCIGLLLFLVI